MRILFIFFHKENVIANLWKFWLSFFYFLLNYINLIYIPYEHGFYFKNINYKVDTSDANPVKPSKILSCILNTL